MPLATTQDAVREYTANVGAERPTQEWLLSDYDTWERNPSFSGTPGRHPEDDQDALTRDRVVYIDDVPF